MLHFLFFFIVFVMLIYWAFIRVLEKLRIFSAAILQNYTYFVHYCSHFSTDKYLCDRDTIVPCDYDMIVPVWPYWLASQEYIQYMFSS